ncbi:MAG TPA: M23 family metallopeptidase [Vicinamibacterales bacterium]|jgi:murein DD-endopeptidase MepM/ murein hydrolase activator NlpD|nr:M23 family metallopeptidase [Vicinamibacterales bacterium]
MLTLVALAFALGALTDAALAWRLRLTEPSREEVPVVAPDADADAPAAAPTGTSGAAVDAKAIETLERDRLTMPVQGVSRNQLHDTFTAARGSSRSHEAIDIMAPRRTPVLAATDGTVAKLFTSKQGGLTIYEFDPSKTFCYYYAHLEAYAAALHEGQTIHRAEVIGYVGTTGNAPPDAPHLHFAIFRLTPEHQWWKGVAVNPYPILTQP